MSDLKKILFVVLLLLGPSSAYAVHWNSVYKLCAEEFPKFFREFTAELPIPVGCEVIDCCPGCPGPGPLDWRIHIDETIVSGATLRFEGIPIKQLRELSIKGNAKIDDDGNILLGAGEIEISGLPAEVDGRVPVGFIGPRASHDYDGVQQSEKRKRASGTDEDASDLPQGIEIVQYRGAFQVNQFAARYYLRPCRGAPATDRLVITNNTSTDNTIAMLDFRSGSGSGGCINDQIVRTTQTANMGSVLSNGRCPSTVSVFSDDNAMSYEPSVSTWTDPLGDTHTVDLQTIITAPVSVWIANNAQLAAAQNDIANANLLFNQNNAGVQFNPTYNNVSGNVAAVAAIGVWCPTAATVGALRASAWYTANTLNAYYVNSAFTGVNCGQDRNINFIGTTANLASLTHEFGHAYGLRPSASWGHTNGVAGFGNTNIMWGGGPGTRNNFTVAQSFRMNTDTTSMLNSNGDRAGPRETCLPNVSSTTCPALSLDSLPH